MRHDYISKTECPKCGAIELKAYTYCFYDKIDLNCSCGYKHSVLNTDENFKQLKLETTGFAIGFLGKLDFRKEFQEVLKETDITKIMKKKGQK